MLVVTAHLASPLAGDAPYLDALLEFEMAQRLGVATRLRRDRPLPTESIHIPILRRAMGSVRHIPCCSAPICEQRSERRENFSKRLGVEHAGLLADKQRLVVATGNATYKSYRLPLVVRDVPRIRWFCEGHRRPVLQLLRNVHSIGHKRSQGYGRVARWEAEMTDGDYWWFAPSEAGPVLMRALPWCDNLPSRLQGYRRSFGACIAPMWHPERYMEIVVPC